MAFRRTIAQRLWANKNTTTAFPPIPRPPPPSRGHQLLTVDDCPTLSFLRPSPRYSTVSVPVPPHCFPALPVGDHLFDRILELNKDRLRLDSLVPPPEPAEVGMTAEEKRKVARAAQMEVARTRLRANAKSCVSGSEFARLCTDIAGGADSGRRLAWALDDSGTVIVLGDVVFLRPDMVAKAIESLIPRTKAQTSDAHKRELERMEEQKAALDAKATKQVRRELWCGLGLLTIQTLGFMRLTFWELSWDVMEPVCFYVTSFYFMVGYAFFMRTSRDPSFEGFFASRFASKQKRLMKAHHFNINRYNALKQQGSIPVTTYDPPPSLRQCNSNIFGHIH